MQAPKNITTEGFNTQSLILAILALAMIFSGIYLTNHYFEAYFPSSLTSGQGLCAINEFWGCDKATKSIMGSIFNIPTSLFGIIMGVMILASLVFSSLKIEASTRFFVFLNAGLCVLLFLFSIIFLKSLCPVCTIYYLLSWASAFIFYKYSSLKPMPNATQTIIFLVLTLIPGYFMRDSFIKKIESQTSLSSQYVKQFNALAVAGDPISDSPYRLNSDFEKFSDAPIRISVFSDFECPFCKVVSEQLETFAKEFKGKINIQYFFYPIDAACNPTVTRPMHQFACKAAFLAACSQDKFVEVHDHIFKNQDKLSLEIMDQWEKDFGLQNCFANEDSKQKILGTIKAGEQYKLNSTPTLIINGKKVEGGVPTIHLRAILQSLL